MPRKILLDSDHLIPFCARNKNSSTYLEVVNLLKAGAKLYCTSLLRYEVLRGLSATDPKFALASKILDQLETINVMADSAALAAKMFYYYKEERRIKGDPRTSEDKAESFKKHNFDLLHFTCAKERGLEFLTKDDDQTLMAKIYAEITQ